MFGETITEFRKRANFNKTHASILLGINSCSLTDVEKGNHRAFTGERLEKLIEIYGLTKEEADLIRRLSYEDRLLIAPHLRNAHINRVLTVPKQQQKSPLIEFGGKIRELRVAAGISAREAARKINTSPLKLVDVEDGLRAVSDDFVNKLSIAYNLTPEVKEELLDLSRKMNCVNEVDVSQQKKLKAQQLYEKIMSEKTPIK